MEALKQVEHLVSAKLAVIKALLSLVRLEARLAGLSVFPLLLNVCMMLIVLMTGWLLISLLVGYGIFLVSNNILLSIFLILIFNAGVLLGLAKYLAFNIKNMSFEKTRLYFSQHASINDEPFKKTDNCTNSNHGKDITTTSTAGD